MSKLMEQIMETFPPIDYETWTTTFKKDFHTFFKKSFEAEHFTIHPLQVDYQSQGEFYQPLKNRYGFGKSMIDVTENFVPKLLSKANTQKIGSYWISEELYNRLDQPEKEQLGKLFFVEQLVNNIRFYDGESKKDCLFFESQAGLDLSQRWNMFKTFLLKNKEQKNKEWIFKFQLSKSGLENIGFIRAAKIFFANHFPEQLPVIIAKGCHFENIESWQDQLLVNAYYALVMAYADVDFFSFKFYEKANLNEMMYHLNLINLLKYEFGFQENRDVFSGSFYIENLTYKILNL